MSEIEENVEMAEDFVDVTQGGYGAGALFGVGFLGLSLGAAAGYFFARRQLETKYNQIAEDEIAEMRTHYRNKEAALDNVQGKADLEEIVKERGYSSEPPMAVTPPDAVVEAAEAAAEEGPGDPRPPVPVVKEENVFQREAPTAEEVGTPMHPRVIDDNWDYEFERSRRTPNRPYVIHVDEKNENDEYGDVITYTYYEEDDVLCNERDEPFDHAERDLLVGEANLNKFGHGSGDPSIVYIRNDKMEMQMEIIRSPNSFQEEVHGFEPSDEIRHQHRRERRFRDDE